MHFTTLITQCLKPRLALKVSPEPSNYISYMQKALQIFLHVLFWSGSTLCALLHGTVLRWGIGRAALEPWNEIVASRKTQKHLLHLSFNSFVTRRHAAIILQKAASKGLLKQGMFAKLWFAPESFCVAFSNSCEMRCSENAESEGSASFQHRQTLEIIEWIK